MAQKIDWSKITEKIKEGESKFKKKVDERFYDIKLKDDGSAQAIIRFLPAPETLSSGDLPYVKKYSHGFKNANGRWFIEDCPTTINKKCPVCDDNSVAWNGGDKDLARSRQRRLSVITNILIIKDPQTPENEGKVFLWRYGKKIHERIMETMQPKSDSIEDPIEVFDPTTGANFKLIVKQVQTEGKSYQNYDSSQFSTPTPIGNEKEIDVILAKCTPLKPFIDPASFKSFDELKEKFSKANKEVAETNEQLLREAPAQAPKEAPAQVLDTKVSSENDTDFFAKIRNDQ